MNKLLLAIHLMVFCAICGCGSSKDGPAATGERGAIPSEWAAAQPLPAGGPILQAGAPAVSLSQAGSPPAAPADPADDTVVLAAVDRYQNIVGRYGGQAEVHLNFSGTTITDADLAKLPLPETVRSIDLSRTQITDAGLAHLRRAPRLERLNLEGTQVTAAGAAILKEMPYLWQAGLDMSQMPIQTQLEMLRFFSSRAEARTHVKPR